MLDDARSQKDARRGEAAGCGQEGSMKSKRSGVQALVLCVLMAAAVGCASGQARRGRERPLGSVRVVVDNRNWEDAIIYVERAGARFKLAMVPGLSARTLTMDARLLNAGVDVRLVAQTRLTRETFYSSLFSAEGARAVELQIGSRLSMSMVSVF
jgi:hypothetical protein